MARIYLAFENKFYRLDTQGTSIAARADSVLRGRDLMFAESGQYGPLMAAYVAACKEAKCKPYYAWRGVMNTLGDVGRMWPPYNPLDTLPEGATVIETHA